MDVLILPHAKCVAYPDARAVTTGWAVDLTTALATPTMCDAHMTQYAPTNPPMRLKNEYFALPGAVVHMRCLVHDYDDPIAHASGTPARGTWRAEFASKAPALGTYVWWTRGGAKAVWRLPGVTELRTLRDTALWSAWYDCTIAHVLDQHGLAADSACADWGRLFRVPYATRAGNACPDAYGTVCGTPDVVATWTADVSACVSRIQRRRVSATPRATGLQPYPEEAFNPTRAGLIPTLLHQRGWLGRGITPGKWACRCPSAAARGDHGLDTSTIVWAAHHAPGTSGAGWLHCSHQRCADLRSADSAAVVRQVLTYFTAEEIAAAQYAILGSSCLYSPK